jgi:hypothetical protein
MGLNKIITLNQEPQTEAALGLNQEREEEVALFEAARSPCNSLSGTIATEPPQDAETSAGVAAPLPVPNQWVVLMRLAMISSLTTCWFLSRTYEITMYLILGLATATLALQRNNANSPVSNRWLSSTLAVEVLSIVIIYGMVRLRF